MNIECKVENKGPITREITISVKPDTIQKFIDREFESLQKKVKMNGFRQGKVPLPVLKKQFMGNVKSDVYSEIVRESYLKALDENKIYAVGMPEIQTKEGATLNDGETLTFTAKVEIFPEVELKDFSKIKVKKKPTEVTADDVKKSISNLLDNHAEVVPNESYSGPAKKGDIAVISFKGTADGQALETLAGNDRQIEIGGGQYMDEFEAGITGMKKGDKKSFDVKFPKDFSDTSLAGKTATFEVELHEFKKKDLPALDDDFAKRFKLETAAELQKKIEETLKEDRERDSKDSLKEEALTELCKLHPFEIPNALIKSQLDFLIKENQTYLKRQGFSEKMIREYLEKNGKELSDRAREQVRTSLILDKVAEKQGIKVESADLDHEFGTMATRLNMSVDQIRSMYEADEQALRQLRYRIKEDRAIEHILSNIQITR